MKGYEIRNCFFYLSRIELSGFDKQTRNAILRTHANLSPKNKEIEEQFKTIDEQLFKGEELQAKAGEVSALRKEYEKATPERREEINKELLTKYPEILDLEKESYTAKTDLLNEDVKVSIVRMNKENFVDGLVAAKMPVTAGDIEAINCLFEK